MISISHAPNATSRQRWQALSLLFKPWRWQTGINRSTLENTFSLAHERRPAFTFATGRQSLYAVLNALGIGQGDEVIIQAYTCIVVPQAILWSGAKPVYADIDASLNIDVLSAKQLLTPRTKALIVQHTFGVPADMRSITAFCKEHTLLLIEDCAHSLGAVYDGKLVGTFGDAAIFSFGRDKIISSVSGGMALVNNHEAAEKMKAIQTSSPLVPRWRVVQNLFHPLLVPFFASLAPFAGLGSILLRLSQGIGLLNKVYTKKELNSTPPEQLTEQLPEAMATLALEQFSKDLQAFNQARRSLAALYDAWLKQHPSVGKAQFVQPNSQPVYLRYAVLNEKASELIKRARRSSIILGDWYAQVIMPQPKDEGTLHYLRGSCPQAETAAKQSLNLPTHPRLSERQQKKLFRWLNENIV